MSAPLDALPGADLVLRGAEEWRHHRETAEAALVETARTRLLSLGVSPPERPAPAVDAELRRYERLGVRYPDRDPHLLYCAWLDPLVSLLAALGQRRERERRTGA